MFIVQARQYHDGSWLRAKYSPQFATKAEAQEWLRARTKYYSHNTRGLYRIVAMDLKPEFDPMSPFGVLLGLRMGETQH